MRHTLSKIPEIVILFVLLVHTVVPETFAASKNSYFAKQLTEWKLPTYTVELYGPTAEKLPTPISEKYFLITTSDLNDILNKRIDDLEYSKIVTVCDEEYEVSGEFRCDFSSVVDTSTARATTPQANIYVKEVLGKHLIVVPEGELVSPKKIPQTTAFVNALGRSFRVEGYENMPSQTNTKQEEDTKASIQTIATILFTGVVIVVLPIVRKLLRNSQRYIGQVSHLSFAEANDIYVSYRKIVLPWLKTAVIGTLPISVGVVSLYIWKTGVKSSVSIAKATLNYLVEFRFLNESLNELPILSSNTGLVVAATVLASIVLWTIYLILLNLPQLKKYEWPLEQTYSEFKNKLVFGTLLVVCTSTLPLSIYRQDSIWILTSMFIFFYISIRSKAIRFTKQEKIKLTIAMTFGMLLTFTQLRSTDVRTTTEAVDQLFSDKDAIVVLPYKREVAQQATYTNYYVNEDFPILVNNYLIYHPGYKQIVNRPLEEFSEAEDYMILMNNAEEMIQTLLNYPVVKGPMTIAEPSEYFYLAKENLKLQQLQATISFNCELELPPSEIYLTRYRKDVEPQELQLLIFPGCAADKSVKTYTVPVETGFFFGDSIYKINNFERANIKEVQLTGNESQHPTIRYIGTPDVFHPTIATGTAEKQTITVYSPMTKSSITFDREEEAVDIAEHVNTLIKREYIKDSFVMWSTQSGSFLDNKQ